MEFNNLLEKLNGNPEKAYDIIYTLGISPYELEDGARSGRIFDVINNLLQVQDHGFLISKLTANKPNVDKIDHMWAYFNIKKSYDAALKNMETIDKDMKEMDLKLKSGMASETDKAFAATLSRNKIDMEKKVASLEQELSFF